MDNTINTTMKPTYTNMKKLIEGNKGLNHIIIKLESLSRLGIVRARQYEKEIETLKEENKKIKEKTQTYIDRHLKRLEEEKIEFLKIGMSRQIENEQLKEENRQLLRCLKFNDIDFKEFLDSGE